MTRALFSVVFAMSTLSVAAGDLFEVAVEADHLIIQPTRENQSYRITLQGPYTTLEARFAGDETAVISLRDEKGHALEDGSWTYRLDARPLLSPGLQRQLASARARGDQTALRRLLPKASENVQSGHFTIAGGLTVEPGFQEETKGEGQATRDQVIFDDLIVDGSACIGLDCINGESFGLDTLRLKEVTLRLKFQDTSSLSGYPTTDWQLTANDSPSGGQEKFAIDDVDTGRTPFTIEADAPDNALYMDSSGRIGFNTSTPAAELHVVSGDTPTLRLEQDTSSGFAAQTWEVFGNETNFAVQDETAGSNIFPMRIRAGASTNSIYVDSDDQIGLGTAEPLASLHLRRTDGSAMILVEDTDSGGSDEAMLKLVNETKTSILLTNNFSTTDWEVFNGTAGFRIDDGASTNSEFEIKNNNEIRIGENGADWLAFSTSGDATMDNDLTVNGTFSNPSDVNLKEEFEAVDPVAVLEKLVALPITTWEYARDEDNARHMGVMAQDFHAAFGLGRDDRYLTSIDPDGVAMAAIQGLDQKAEERSARIAQLEEDKAALAERLADNEARLAALEAQVRALLESAEKK